MQNKGFNTFLFLILISCTYSQSKQKKTNSTKTSVIESVYGYNLYSNSINQQLNTFKDFKFDKPIRFVGFQSPNYGLVINPRLVLQFFSFLKILPENIKLNDSVRSAVNGFNFSMSFYDYNFFKKNKVVDLYIGLGLHTGQLKLTSAIINQKNPVLAPQVLIYNNFIVKRISISFFGSYFYDISNTAWKKTWSGKKDLAPVNSFNQSGFRIGTGIGWTF